MGIFTLTPNIFKSSPVQTDLYLLACIRYIVLNPVRASMVSEPDSYLWSSYRQRVGVDDENWIDYDPCYLRLGESEQERRQQYMRFVAKGVPDKETSLVRQALQRGQLTGNDRFVDEVEKILGRRVEFRGCVRPGGVGNERK